MKSVAIIGAGPAGIIAARKLLQSGKFTVTIYEQNNHVGGSWLPEGIIDPKMRTNQLKFTMNFSDLSWESLRQTENFVPIYPKASQVLRYLEDYCERYIPQEVVQLRIGVQEVKQVEGDLEHGQLRWELKLHAHSKDGTIESSIATFDYVVAAPGFFYNAPKKPPFPWPTGSPVPILHSTQYRGLGAIESGFTSEISGKRRVVVIGGSHSGGEIAALIALQLSNAQYSPSTSESERVKWKDVEIVHLSSREMFALPNFTRDTGASQCSFQPIDFALFSRSSRPADPPPSFTAGLVTPERVKAIKKLTRSILGDEGTLGGREEDELAPAAIMGETYAQYTKSRQIVQVRGMLSTLLAEKGPTLAARVNSSHGSTLLQNICAVVYATGFDVASSVSFLSTETKTALEFEPSCPQAPLILDRSSFSGNRAVPTLAVMGFPGGYWPLLEMQARTIVRDWTETLPIATPSQETQSTELIKYYQDLRTAVRECRKAEVPRNPFGDNVGLLEQASRELEGERFDLGFSETEGFICSARYTEPSSDKTEPMKTLMAVQAVRRKSRAGGYLARAVFHGLLGEWVAACKNRVGGIEFVHQAFHPRNPTDAASDWEYLWLKTSNGKVSRKVIRYCEETDCISVWATGEDGFRAGKFVDTLDFLNYGQERGKDTAVATMSPDSNFQFCFTGATLQTWTMVRGEERVNFIRVGSVE